MSSTPPPADHEPPPFDPFPFGRPEPGSPAAAAFPDLFPPAAPTPAPPSSPPPGYAAPPTWTSANPVQYGPPPSARYSPPPGPPSAYPPAGYGYPPPDPGAPYDRGGPPYGYPSPAPGNGLAVTGLVFGCLAVVLCVLTVFDVPVIGAGIAFSLLGLRAARRGQGQRRLAVAGLVLSLVAGLAVTVIGVVLVRRYEHCQQLHDRGTTAFNECVIPFSS